MGYRLKYPEEAVKAGVTIRVVYSFVVEKDGSVNDIKRVATHVARDSNNPDVIAAEKACEKAAYDIVASTSHKWRAAQNNGVPTSCKMSLPIWFKFPEIQNYDSDSASPSTKENENEQPNVDTEFPTNPLVIVDGVEISSISLVKPEDIHAVTVLTNGAATSAYGSRAANGVIIVTTKKGRNKQGD